MKNEEISHIFNDIADILEIKEENVFRIRAYRKAAETIEGLTEDVALLAKKKDLSELPGIGKDLAGKILEYIKTGRMKAYEDLKKSIAKPVLEMMSIPGVGAKTAQILYSKLKIKSINDLKKKVSKGLIQKIFGFKDKKIANILRGIEFLKRSEGQTLLADAIQIADNIIKKLKRLPEVKVIKEAGSLRRMKETVRDIDILLISSKPKKVMDLFVKLPEVKEVLAHGTTKASVITKANIQVDVRVVEKENFGSALCYFTGSKSHNIKLRKMAKAKGLKISEYGVFKGKKEEKIASQDEKSIYGTLNMDYVPPEMREDKGEIELAKKHKLPKLITLDDIKGDLHVHTESSDGILSLEAIRDVGESRGYQYIIITDHSQSLKVAHGLSVKDLMKNVEKIHKMKSKKTKLLSGSEVDILSDGKLDYPDSVLKELDFVIAAVHTGFKQPKDVITNRILKAMDNKYVNMIAHPTGRLIGVREPYPIDLEKVLKKAKECNVSMEINAFPERLDLDDLACHRARELGVSIGIGTDSHVREQFDNMRFGVSVARRGWLEKQDILNTLDLKNFLKKIKR